MTIKGTIEKVIADKGTWASVIFIDDKRITHKCAGSIVNPIAGAEFELTGEIYDDPKWGRQFKVSSSKQIVSSKDQIIDYLSSSYIKGIGPATARKIFEMFGKDSIDIVEFHPERLTEIKGISTTRALMAQKSIQENHAFLNLLEKLGGKATPHQINTLYEKYGTRVYEVIEKNPYIIIYDCDGFGFKRADALAKASGITDDDPRRIAAAITYTLKTLGDEGHCFCRIDSLEANLHDLVENVPDDLIANCIVSEIENGRLVLEDDRLYTHELYTAENGCVNIVSDLIRPGLSRGLQSNKIDIAISMMERENGFELEIKQKEAIRIACKSRFSIITGGPGTGKTTIVKGIINAISKVWPVILAAPTGKASRRMSEVTNKHATTIHRMLAQNSFRSLSKPFFIIDEASMIDIHLAYRILKAVKDCDGSICFIGDVDQLPPVGPGNFLRDLLSSGLVPKVKLELCHRQKGTIAINADRINQGKGTHCLNLSDPSFQMLEAGTNEDSQRIMIDQYLNAIKEYPMSEVCCLSPMKTRSSTGTNILNEIIREMVNPLKPGMLTFDKFRINDRVMETQNDPKRDVYNGDCGNIISIDPLSKCMTVETDDGRLIEYGKYDISTLVFAYAMTIHKSQGSEFKVVIVANMKEHFIMLQRNLLYTGITRAREKVILIGSRQAVDIAVSTTKAIDRNSFLKQKLIQKAVR